MFKRYKSNYELFQYQIAHVEPAFGQIFTALEKRGRKAGRRGLGDLAYHHDTSPTAEDVQEISHTPCLRPVRTSDFDFGKQAIWGAKRT